ncbi:MAG: hypothetical protein DHS20C05_16690 [Hyphococcus sp.]|nr:MAG: hypothetical protein DHS20C05_16690 [Marinicaulis sp.]
MTEEHQKGFALTDALIAAAIAAGVAVTAAQSISMAVRSVQKAKEINRVIDDAEIIDARMEAGLRGSALLAGLEGWVLASSPYTPDDTSPDKAAAFIKITATHAAPPAYSIDWVVNTPEGL